MVLFIIVGIVVITLLNLYVTAVYFYAHWINYLMGDTQALKENWMYSVFFGACLVLVWYAWWALIGSTISINFNVN